MAPRKPPKATRAGSWNMRGTRRRPWESAVRIMQRANFDVLLVQEPGAGMLHEARRRGAAGPQYTYTLRTSPRRRATIDSLTQPTNSSVPTISPSAQPSASSSSDQSQGRQTRSSAAETEFPVQAHVVQNPSENGGPLVVLSRSGDPTFQTTVTEFQVQDRSFALVRAVNQGNEVTVATGHAPYQGATANAFMNSAANAARDHGADALLLDTNQYGPVRGQQTPNQRPRRSTLTGVEAWNGIDVGGTTHHGAVSQPLDRVYENPNSHGVVQQAGRILSNSGSSTQLSDVRPSDIVLNLDPATQQTYADADHLPIFADLSASGKG
jgi:hypothetical protein